MRTNVDIVRTREYFFVRTTRAWFSPHPVATRPAGMVLLTSLALLAEGVEKEAAEVGVR